MTNTAKAAATETWFDEIRQLYLISPLHAHFGLTLDAVEDGRVVVGMDGKQVFHTSTNVINEPMYLMLNVAVGGNWPGAPNSSTPFPATMQVDYVKVWQKA